MRNLTFLTGLLLTALLTPSVPAQWYELSGDPGVVHSDPFGDVIESHDGEFVIYRAQIGIGPTGWYRVASDGSTDPVLLTPLVAGATSGSVRISPDDQWMVYTADHDVLGRRDLYSVRTDGSAPAQRLSQPIHSNARIGGSHVLSDSSGVVYVHDAFVDDKEELFRVPIDGSDLPTRLTPTLGANQSLNNRIELVESLSVVVYLLTQSGQPDSLFTVPLDGSQITTLLSGTHDVGPGWSVTPDGTRTAYPADIGVDEDAYSVPTDGSASATRFTLTPRWESISVSFSPDSATALICAFAPNGIGRVFTAPADASTSPLNLTGGFDVDFGELSPDGTQVAFRDDASTPNLFSVPADGSSAPVQLTHLVTNFGVSSFEFTPDSVDLVYSAEDPVAIRQDLWVVPVDGSDTPTMLSAGNKAVFSYELSPVGDRVAYNTISFEWEVWSVATDGSDSPMRLNGPLPANARLFLEGYSADGQRVYYHGDQHTKDVDEYYAAYARPQTGIGLDVEPETPAPGDAVAMGTSGGVPAGRVLWYLTGVDGTPLFLKLASTTLDGTGTSSLAGNLPNDPGLSGVELAFASFSVNGPGQVVGSNRQEILVQ